VGGEPAQGREEGCGNLSGRSTAKAVQYGGDVLMGQDPVSVTRR
jgi:hypothetical protein